MKVAVFVQARMRSSRLPGKALAPVWRGMPLLEMVLRRAAAATEPEEVVLLTGDSPFDDLLPQLAERAGASVFRGDEQDVLGRFVAALDERKVDAVVRVCADNPFVDPAAIDELVRFFRAHAPLDYASNHTAESGLPDGSGAEIVSAEALREAARTTDEPRDREHVTIAVSDGRNGYRIQRMAGPQPPWPRLKLDIDTPRDLRHIREVARRLPAEGAPLWDLGAVVEAARANSLV